MTTPRPGAAGAICHPSNFDGPAPLHDEAALETLVKRWNASGGARAGEIKPHTKSGIRAGLNQLATRCGTRSLQMKMAVLVTYRRRDNSETEAEILIAEVDVSALPPCAKVGDKRVAPRGGRVYLRGPWLKMAVVPFAWTTPIPLAQCPSCVGTLLEVLVRQRVGRQLNLNKRTQGKAATDKGPDLQEIERLRDEVDYLRELVQELSGG